MDTTTLNGSEGARERGSEGARERGSEGARERGSEGARERGSEGARERGSEGAREQGSKGAREQGSKGAREQGSKGAREQGSKGAREQGSKGAREQGSIQHASLSMLHSLGRVNKKPLEAAQPEGGSRRSSCSPPRHDETSGRTCSLSRPQKRVKRFASLSLAPTVTWRRETCPPSQRRCSSLPFLYSKLVRSIALLNDDHAHVDKKLHRSVRALLTNTPIR